MAIATRAVGRTAKTTVFVPLRLIAGGSEVLSDDLMRLPKECFYKQNNIIGIVAGRRLARAGLLLISVL